MRSLLVIPEGSRPSKGWPCIVAIHDMLGFTSDIWRIACRFADAGYAVLVPAVYDGAGAPVLCVVRTYRDMLRGQGAAFERLEDARSFVSMRLEIDRGHVGVAGFCMGGGLALAWAARGGFQVCANFYGAVPRDKEALRRVCPVVASFGARDRLLLPHARNLKRYMAELGVPHDIEVYPVVGHSFMSDHGRWADALGRLTPLHAVYDAEVAERAWKRTLAFFAEHL